MPTVANLRTDCSIGPAGRQPGNVSGTALECFARPWTNDLLFGGGLVAVLGLVLSGGGIASRLLGQIVYQSNPRDPVVVGGAVLTMALLGMAASAIPAWRALAVDPAKLMREE